MSLTSSPGKGPDLNDDDASAICRTGWRQGSLFSHDHIKELIKDSHLPGNIDPFTDLIFIISHDCDITHQSFATEPIAEIFVARQITENDIDGNKTNGKNIRYFQFEINAYHYEISAQNRYCLDRKKLLTHPPKDILPVKALQQIRLWTAKRYFRDAFPTNFNNRVKPKLSKIRELLAKTGGNISAIYFFLDTDELPDKEPYEIYIRGTMQVDDFNDSKKRSEAQAAFDKMASILDRECPGIRVKDNALVSEKSISIDDMRFLKRWDFDDLSTRKIPPLPVAPTVK